MRHPRDVVAAAVVLSSVLLCNPAGAGVRAFVASTGNDANTASQCGPTTPCRGFTAAMSVVDPNGEIIALDAAGYGAVTVTKSVSIIANPGVYAGVAASTGTAITIATASVNVVLRGLNINNIGTATVGVNMTNGSRLVIDNCTISNFSNYGVIVNTNADVRISNSAFRAPSIVVAGASLRTKAITVLRAANVPSQPSFGGSNCTPFIWISGAIISRSAYMPMTVPSFAAALLT